MRRAQAVLPHQVSRAPCVHVSGTVTSAFHGYSPEAKETGCSLGEAVSLHFKVVFPSVASSSSSTASHVPSSATAAVTNIAEQAA